MNKKSPKTITIFLTDGSPSGIKTAEIGGRIGKAVVIPRSLVKEAGERKELNEVGIYFLIGDGAEIDLPEIYIGEAENIYKRLRDHNNKDFWNLAICFTSQNQSLTKAHVKYLEGYCYDLANNIRRCSLQNSSAPAKTKLPETTLADTHDFFKNLKLLISTLGYPIFDELTESTESINSKHIYLCKGPNAKGSGEYTPEGFVVHKDSIARKEFTNTVGESVKNQRNKLLSEGILIENDNNTLRFTADYLLKSPSGASDMVLARSSNGWLEWKDEKGNTLDKNERQ